MAKINGARKGNAKKDLANKAAQQGALKLVDQSQKSEATASNKQTSSKNPPDKKERKSKSPGVKPFKKARVNHSEFKIIPFASLADATSGRVSLVASHQDARENHRKLIIALKARPSNQLSTRLESLPKGSSMDRFDFSESFVYLKVKDSGIKVYRKTPNEVLFTEYLCTHDQIEETFTNILGNIKFLRT